MLCATNKRNKRIEKLGKKRFFKDSKRFVKMEFKKLSRKDKYQLIIDKLNLNSFDEKYLEDVYRFLRLKDQPHPYVLGHTDYLTSADEDCNVKMYVEYDRGWKEAKKGNSRLFVKRIEGSK